jgi:hypothetical protein
MSVLPWTGTIAAVVVALGLLDPIAQGHVADAQVVGDLLDRLAA